MRACGFPLVLFALITTGCGGGGGGDNTIAEVIAPPLESGISCVSTEDMGSIQGCWATDDCDELDSGSGSTSVQYGYLIYSFTEMGYLESELRIYNSSDCVGEYTASSSPGADITYSIGGPVTASDGTDATQIAINISTPEREIEFETVFAILDGNQLCTTQSLQFGTTTSTMGDLGDDLNYNQCLLRK
jgi:hypothetical protein